MPLCTIKEITTNCEVYVVCTSFPDKMRILGINGHGGNSR